MKTREDYIKICGVCTQRSFDPNQGIVCGITKEIASFEGDCSDYEEDKVEKERVHATPIIDSSNEEDENNGAQKDMLYGALWCIGGTIATVSEIGYIFWGAIVFGAAQFIKGLVSYQKEQ